MAKDEIVVACRTLLFVSLDGGRERER